jgi:hypothetical protein
VSPAVSVVSSAVSAVLAQALSAKTPTAAIAANLKCFFML